jgi:hypothetical protein
MTVKAGGSYSYRSALKGCSDATLEATVMPVVGPTGVMLLLFSSAVIFQMNIIRHLAKHSVCELL